VSPAFKLHSVYVKRANNRSPHHYSHDLQSHRLGFYDAGRRRADKTSVHVFAYFPFTFYVRGIFGDVLYGCELSKIANVQGGPKVRPLC